MIVDREGRTRCSCGEVADVWTDEGWVCIDCVGGASVLDPCCGGCVSGVNPWHSHATVDVECPSCGSLVEKAGDGNYACTDRGHCGWRSGVGVQAPRRT